jgi:hypothetical protein
MEPKSPKVQGMPSFAPHKDTHNIAPDAFACANSQYLAPEPLRKGIVVLVPIVANRPTEALTVLDGASPEGNVPN